jgi:hypothetical protein
MQDNTADLANNDVIAPVSSNPRKKNMMAVLLRATKLVEKISTAAEQKIVKAEKRKEDHMKHVVAEKDRKDEAKNAKRKRQEDADDRRVQIKVEKREQKEHERNKQKADKHDYVMQKKAKMREQKEHEREKNEADADDRRMLRKVKKKEEQDEKMRIRKAMVKVPIIRRGKPTREVELTTPYCVPANGAIYETVRPANIVEPEAVGTYVNEQFVKDTVAGLLSSGTVEGYIEMNTYIQTEYGPLFKSGYFGNSTTGFTDTVVKKLWHVNQAFIQLAKIPVQDTRCIVTGRTVIEMDKFFDEINGDLAFMPRRGRGITVNDPLFFNSFMREVIHSHPTFPRCASKRVRGTKSVTDIMHLIGLVPPVDAHSHNSPYYRGWRTTDPDKAHPDGPREGVVNGKQKDGSDAIDERDGLYFRRYEYDVIRIYTVARNPKYFRCATAAKSSQAEGSA